MDPIVLTGRDLTIEQVVAVARDRTRVTLAPSARERIERSRQLVAELARRGVPIYGVTTSLAEHRTTPVGLDEVAAFQERVVLSHAVGVGPPLPADVVRAMMVVRANTIAAGGSGGGSHLVDGLLALLNRGVTPRVPAHGSLGVTDLTHMAHIALVLLGQGEAEVDGAVVPGADALRAAGIEPLRLESKEGLTLVAGQGVVGRGALVLADCARLVETADAAAALSLEGFEGNVSPFRPEVEAAHPDPGQAATAHRIRDLLEGSRLNEPGVPRSVQDPYSFRCIPQVHGAVRNALAAAEQAVTVELNTAGDNPLVWPETDAVVSNGNFLILSVALAFEQLAIALAHLSALSTARVRALMAPNHSGLPGTLVPADRPRIGMMVLQELGVSLQAQIRLRANPSSLDFAPIAHGVEDHATMAMDAVAKVEGTLADLVYVLAAELIAGAQAVDMRGRRRLGQGARSTYEAVRRVAPFIREDQPLAALVEAVAEQIRIGRLR